MYAPVVWQKSHLSPLYLLSLCSCPSSVCVLCVLCRLNRLQKVMVGEAGQLAHVVQLDVRDAGLSELDVRPLSRLELLRCDRNTLSFLRVSGHTLKGLHAAHNGTNITCVWSVFPLYSFSKWCTTTARTLPPLQEKM